MAEDSASFGGKKRGRYYGWWVLGSTSVLGAIADGILLHSYAVFFRPIRRDLGISSTEASVVFSLSRAQAVVSGPIAGSAIDRLGAGPVIMVGGLVAGLGFVLLHWVDSYLVLALVYVGLVSVGKSSGLFQALVGAVNTWFIGRRPLAMSVLETGFAAGPALILPLITLGVHSIGWRDVMLYSGVFVALTTVPLAMVVRRSPESMGIEPEGLGKAVTRGQAKDANPGSATGAVDLSVREALRTSSFWMLLTATVLKMALTVAITVHAVEIAVWKGMDEKTGGFMLALIFFLAIPARLAVGMVGLRFPFQPLLIVGSVAAGLSLLSLLLLDGNLAVYLFVIFMAVLRGTAPLQWVAMGEFFGRRSFSSLLGILQIFTSVFTLVSPIYAGWVFDTTDSYTLVLVTFIPLYALGALFYLAMRKPNLARSEGDAISSEGREQ